MGGNYMGGNFILYRRGAVTDRFFACTSKRLLGQPRHLHNPLNEQAVYNVIKDGAAMRSVRFLPLSPRFVCGQGAPGVSGYDLNKSYLGRPCVFVHNGKLPFVASAHKACRLESHALGANHWIPADMGGLS